MRSICSASLLAAFTVSLCSAAAIASPTSVSDNYQRTGPGESITAPFVNIGGTPTVGTYGGLTEIIVTGTGFALGPTVSDAFYYMSGSPVGIYYGLNIGYTGLPFAGGQPNNIQGSMEFIETIGLVAPGTIPAYRPGHDYRFVLDLPQTAGVLRFGVSDGSYGDNGGAYTVSVFPVVAGAVAVPEPSALSLFLLPIVGVVIRRTARSRKGD